jgi:hypothetical protein
MTVEDFRTAQVKIEQYAVLNIPVLGQWCQFIKKKDSGSFLFIFFFNKQKDFCCMLSGHPPQPLYMT